MKWNRICEYIIKRIPKKHEFHGTLLHRILGEELFDPRLWKPIKKSVAGGLAVGVFVSLIPAIGMQMLLAGLICYVFRFNIPIAMVATWITNPVTSPAIIPLQYKLGVLISGEPSLSELSHYKGIFKIFIRYGKPFWIGSIISGVFFGLLSYIMVLFLWNWISKFKFIKK